MRELAADIAGLLDALKIDQSLMVGHSMGGYVTLAFAQAYPERLLGLGMVASQAAGDTPERRVERFAIAEKVLIEGSKSFADLNAPQLTDDPEIQEQLYRIIAATDPSAIAAGQKGMAERPDLIPILPELNLPAVIIHGHDDRLIPIERARETADGLPRGVLFEIPDAFHMPMMELPMRTAEPINQICAEVISLHPEFL
jgi:pimeloyl-ACP methyl ester carboxylesterase